MKERLFYLDFVRAIATFVIIMTHYNALYIFNVYNPDKAIISTRFFNIYIGSLGVSLFLIISGAALMYVYEKEMNIIKFYKKRMLNIYPLYWLAYGLSFLFVFYENGNYRQDVPRKNIIFSILGVDQFVSNYGIKTFAIIGEWFLGFILIYYLIFPLLRKLVNEHPICLLIVSGIIYILFLKLDIEKDIKSMNIFVRMPEFLFGMYFVKYIKNTKIWMVCVAIALLIFNTGLTPTIDENVQTTYVGIACFIVLVFIAGFIKNARVKRICSVICTYSYPCFLIHHFVIYRVVAKFDLWSITRTSSYLLFMVCVIQVAFFSWALNTIYKKLKKILSKE